MENEGHVVKLDSSQNFRKKTFEFCKCTYELAISLYTNAIFIIITPNGKIGNMYIMDIDDDDNEETLIRDELQEDNIITDNTDTIDAPRIESSSCVLGDRRNEKTQFISDFILSFISKQLIKRTTAIDKLILSITLSAEEYDDVLSFELTQHNKELIDIIKLNISQLLNI
jgi:hypothetical protein